MGKLVLPQSLIAVFCNKVGWRETKRIIHKYQEVVVDKMDDELKSGWQGRFKRKRLSVFVEDMSRRKTVWSLDMQRRWSDECCCMSGLRVAGVACKYGLFSGDPFEPILSPVEFWLTFDFTL